MRSSGRGVNKELGPTRTLFKFLEPTHYASKWGLECEVNELVSERVRERSLPSPLYMYTSIDLRSSLTSVCLLMYIVSDARFINYTYPQLLPVW